MFGWFKKKAGRLYPECLWTVTLTDDGVETTDQAGATMSVSRDDLSSIAIETNDSGPWGADVWWLLFGPDGQLACAFPQGATGEKDVLDFLMALPGFDQQEVIKAMGSTANAIFPVWRRQV